MTIQVYEKMVPELYVVVDGVKFRYNEIASVLYNLSDFSQYITDRRLREVLYERGIIVNAHRVYCDCSNQEARTTLLEEIELAVEKYYKDRSTNKE